MSDDHHHHHHHHGHHDHAHGPVHLSEAEWASYAAHTALQGEVFFRFLTDTLQRVEALRGPQATPVRRILDVGSGPGVSSCQLAQAYPEATVTAVDSSPAMLSSAADRAQRLGLSDRVHTLLAELPNGLDAVQDIDLIWASMSIHHIGDEVEALRALQPRMRRDGIIAIAELADPTRLLPDTLEVGRPGLAARLETVGGEWFADMRRGLPGSVEAGGWSGKLVAAGYEVLDDRVARDRLDAPLSGAAREVAQGELLRLRKQFGERLEADDRDALDILCDESDARGAMHRADLFMDSSRQILIARPAD